MKSITVGKAKVLTVPDTATTVTVTHEWGDVVVNAASVSGTYSFTSDSVGVHKFVWKAGASVVQTDFYDSVVPLISSTDFFGENADLEAFDEDFAKIERLVRNLVQNYTGQKFGPYVNKTLEVQGDGGDSLLLPVRVVALTSIETNYGDDITELVEVSPNEPSILQKSSRFRGAHYYEVKRDLWYQKENLFNDRYVFSLVGTFGWEYVPQGVTEAAGLLVGDMLGGDDIAEMRRRGIFEKALGDFSLRLNADQWGTTGNTQADNLLAEFVNFGMGLV